MTKANTLIQPLNRTIFLCAIFIALSFLPRIGLQAQSTWYDKGKATDNNNLKVEYFTRTLKEERKDRWVYYFRAWAYYGLGRYDKALRDFHAGENAEGNLDDSFLHSGMAWVYYRQEKYTKGLEYADKSIKERDSNSEAWNAKGWLLINLKKPQAAVTAFSKYIALKPDLYLGYSNRSYAYVLIKDYSKVIDDCEKALEIDKGNEFLLERKAFALMKLGRNAEAMTLIKEKISFKPDDPRSLSNIGALFYRNEDYKTAIGYHTRGMKLYELKIKDDREYMDIYRDDIYAIYMARGDCHYALKDYQRALADYKKATKIKPDDFRAWKEIGQLQTFQKNWSEGAKAYEKAFALNPTLKYGWVNLGFCYDNLGEPYRAISAYTRGIKNNPEVGLLYNNRGYGYLELKQYEKAFADLSKAIEVEPDIVMSHVSLGEYYYDRKMYGDAIKKMNQAIKMDDGTDQAYTAAYYTRGMCYFAQDNFKEAKKNFLKAISINSDHVLAHEKLGISYFELEEFCEAYKTLKATLNLESTLPVKQAKQAPKYLGKMTKNPCLN
ncbi:MAG TPA: tetratricopeptide repeat protein [Bacteroidetes bacterium]|nr:tetratricopeptide repeat protein [Bacteroidota bacterium]